MTMDTNTIDWVEIGVLFKQERERRGLSLKDAELATGVSASTLSRLENGKGITEFPLAERVANWLGIPLNKPTEQTASVDTMYAVREVLRADSMIDQSKVPGFMEMFSLLYDWMVPKKRVSSK